MFLICVTLLVAKACNNQFFLSWYDGFAPLANWNMQAANVILVISYALRDFLALRLSIFLGCLCFVLYGATSSVGMMLDMMSFNILLALLNLHHALQLMWEKRYVKFSPELEQVYCNLFRPYMPRSDFARLSAIALPRTEKRGVVIKERGDLVTSLCILVSGRVEVLNGSGEKVNEYHSNDFLEAPEWVKWDLDPDSARFWVSFKTQVDCSYLKWPRESLVRLLRGMRHAGLLVKLYLSLLSSSYFCSFVFVFHYLFPLFLSNCFYFSLYILFVSILVFLFQPYSFRKEL